MVLSVTDPDLPPNGGSFQVLLDWGEHKDYFEVETHSGLIKTTKNLDRESTPELEILVAVQDSGNPVMSSQNSVKIVVLDKNDSPSTSRPLTVLVWVHSKSFPGGKIADVHPQDLDMMGEYQCQIMEGNTAMFRIPRNCDLHTTKFDNLGVYTLTVSGNDGKHRNVSSTIRVKFLNFDNATLQNSVSLRVWNFSADTFLAIHYDNFLRVLESIFKPSSHPVVYSIVNVEEHLEITLASKSSEDLYLSSHDVISVLNEKSPLLREVLEEKRSTLAIIPVRCHPAKTREPAGAFWR
ncbi:protocadherin Fat 4 [Caerostris extrusa]|uniref:Protocadherin Fat 4 n=1 Tax=Caerostris extrusa TaxID=172846 RepID=A0AAV4TLI2_CAEEX|nr:protocadherin Fat 4 [Caerostris extrusa]